MKIFATALAFVVLAACDQIPKGIDKAASAEEQKKCQINNETLKAQAENNTAMQNRMMALQLEVVKQCVASHNIPVFINGNVDCKKEPK